MRQFSLTRILLLVLLISTTSIQSRAQIAAWDFTGEGTTSTITSAADVFNTNMDASNLLTRGAGAAWSTGGNSFRTTGFQNNGIATANTDYFQFTLSASAGYLLSLSTIDAKFAGTGTFAASPGVSSQFAYSLDGTTFTLIGTASVTVGTPATLPQINLSSIPALQNLPAATTVTFRYYASGQTATGGWGLNSSAAGIYGLAVGGSVVSALSNNADLSDLTLSTGILTPAFGAATTSYTSNVSNATTSITVTPITSNAGATVTVNGIAVTSGNASAAIPLSVGANVITTVVTAEDLTTTKTYTTTVTRAAAGVPLLTATAAIADFGPVCINNSTGPNFFTIDGSDLDGSNISIAALPGFSYSETPAGTYTATLSFSYTAPGFSGKNIYVKFNPAAVQSYNGNIILSGGGVTSFAVAVTGSGINTAAAVTTGASTAVTATSGTPSGTITVAGCSAVTAYGIEYSTSSGFLNGTGIQVAASNLSAGNFSATVTGLIPNTRYYYKAYATTGAGTSYGTQSAFTCAPLPVPMAAQPGLSYTEDFADITDWSNFFILGDGANHFNGLSAVAGSGIPGSTGIGTTGGTTITTSTASFQTNATGTPPAITSGGVQRGTDQLAPIPTTQSIILLSTGSASENSTSAAIDFYMDFTSVNAGTLSFDYQTFSNALGTGANDRAGSLRVYSSPDGIVFTEITNVLNFINNTPISGSKTNISLPASFNNNPNARLRFYYHNGTGGTNGSRPKISIDNITVTALAAIACSTPTAAATNLTFGTITDVSVQGSFTAASPAPDHYLVVRSTSSTLSANPADGTTYAAGDALGGGTVVSYTAGTNFTATGLTASTQYYFFIFSVNGVCTGGPLYYTTTILNGTASTIAPPPTCAAPAAQASNLVFGTTTINSIQASFTATAADEYLVLRSTSSTLTNDPVTAQTYNAGDVLGNAVVIQRNAATTFTANGLLPNTAYYFFVFSINSLNCVNGPAYNTTTPLNGTQTTLPLPACTTPSAQPTVLSLTAGNTSVTGSFTAAAGTDDYLIVRSTAATLSASPVDNTDYNAGDNIGGGIVVSNNSGTGLISTGLTANTTYYFFVFAANKNCSGGTKYNITNPLTGNIATTNVITNNYYFGTFHSHSAYSDGTNLPDADYDFAKNAECMDYLGISEHNHNTVGTTVSNYHLGVSAADNYTATHANFLAMYGMEWGVINNGGHVVIYGNGMNNLWGWESGAGTWGPTDNYDEFVPKSTYLGSTGLFKKVNDNIGTNTFATLAHPDSAHFTNLGKYATGYFTEADDAVVGTAVESGPAFSTNTTYTNPSTMSLLWYYQRLLSKGYHLGPTIDHDNHENTFGRTTRARTAIIAPVLTKAAIVDAMRNMHFYATEDCDSKVDFTVNTKIMGTIMTGSSAPNISVTLTDGVINTPPPTTTPIIRVMFGVPGSNVLPVKIDSAVGTSLNFTDNNLANLSTGYYYIDITTANGGSIITAPIWYTRNDINGGPLPVSLNNFTVQKMDNIAKISWSTEQESNSSHFVVERSSDGRTWNSIATVAAAGISTTRKDYSIYDNAPLKGMNYYRLQQVDRDNKMNYSVVKTALFNSRNIAEVAPNPAKEVINLYLSKTGNKAASIQLLNASGKLVYSTTSSQSHVPINTTQLSKGLYFVKVINAEEVTTIRVLVQ